MTFTAEGGPGRGWLGQQMRSDPAKQGWLLQEKLVGGLGGSGLRGWGVEFVVMVQREQLLHGHPVADGAFHNSSPAGTGTVAAEGWGSSDFGGWGGGCRAGRARI